MEDEEIDVEGIDADENEELYRQARENVPPLPLNPSPEEEEQNFQMEVLDIEDLSQDSPDPHYFSHDPTVAAAGSDPWNHISAEIRDLHGKISEMLPSCPLLESLSPMDFIVVAFSPRRLKARFSILKSLLMTVGVDEGWWVDQDPSQAKINPHQATFNKSHRACTNWGIEDNIYIILGYGTGYENLCFWQKVIKVVKSLVKDKAIALLEAKFPDDETHVSWRQAVYNAEQALLKETTYISFKEIAFMDRLIMNGMLDTVTFQEMANGIARILRDFKLDKETTMHSKKECMRDDHNNCVAVKKAGQSLFDYIQTFVNFMKDNSNFEKNKTEFIAFHSEFSTKFMDLYGPLLMHRQFLKILAEFSKPNDIVNGTSKVP